MAAIAFGIVGLATPRAAFAHATLLRSTPAANSKLASSPDSIRLVFSEEVVPSLSQIAAVCSRGDSVQLKVANDPHNVHVLVGTVGAQLAGSCRVLWRVLSADGHPVSGNFAFEIAGGADLASSTTPASAPNATLDSVRDGTPVAAGRVLDGEEKPIPVFASLFRGVGLGAFMAGIGLLFFGLTAGERRTLTPGASVTSLVAIGTLLLVTHAFAWVEHASPTGHLTWNFVSSILNSTVGRVELARVIFAVLALWAAALARHRKIALGLGVACLVVSGAVGHPAAINPLISIPSKIVHLLAVTAWIGGLLWLAWVARSDAEAFRIEALRVSSVALVAVTAILLSGLLQAVLFLNTPSDLFRYAYGKLVFNKIVGLLILIGFGIYNKYRLIPRVDGVDAQRKLTRSVKLELAVMTMVILISGFLAYVPTPPSPQAAPVTRAGVSP